MKAFENEIANEIIYKKCGKGHVPNYKPNGNTVVVVA